MRLHEKDNYGHRKLNVYTVNFDHFKKECSSRGFVLFLKKGNGKTRFQRMDQRWNTQCIFSNYTVGKNELEYLKNRLMYPRKIF